jgi:hypothetical protein
VKRNGEQPISGDGMDLNRGPCSGPCRGWGPADFVPRGETVILWRNNKLVLKVVVLRSEGVLVHYTIERVECLLSPIAKLGRYFQIQTSHTFQSCMCSVCMGYGKPCRTLDQAVNAWKRGEEKVESTKNPCQNAIAPNERHAGKYPHSTNSIAMERYRNKVQYPCQALAFNQI